MPSATVASFSPSVMPPPDASREARKIVSGDRSFALHGEITMLILVMFFTVFLMSILIFLCMKQPSNATKLSLHPDDIAADQPATSTFPVFDGRISRVSAPI